MKPAPTYEEFKKIIWNKVIEHFKGYRDEADLRAYLEREAGDVSYLYNKTLKDYMAGETTYRQFTEGIPAGLAFDLIMCY